MMGRDRGLVICSAVCVYITQPTVMGSWPGAWAGVECWWWDWWCYGGGGGGIRDREACRVRDRTEGLITQCLLTVN